MVAFAAMCVQGRTKKEDMQLLVVTVLALVS